MNPLNYLNILPPSKNCICLFCSLFSFLVDIFFFETFRIFSYENLIYHLVEPSIKYFNTLMTCYLSSFSGLFMHELNFVSSALWML